MFIYFLIVNFMKAKYRLSISNQMSEVSQKEKHQYSILMHIYGI